MELPGIDHLPWTGDSEAVLGEIEEFLTGGRSEPEPDRVLATVMFTDIVGSTERAAELGDARWRELLAAHQAVVRRELTRFRGREVKTLGDGYLATFDGPARAIRCGGAIGEAARSLGLEVRIGLHCGEVELMEAGYRLGRRAAATVRAALTLLPANATRPVGECSPASAERAGFEPARELAPPTRLAGECLQPLGHLSGAPDCRAGGPPADKLLTMPLPLMEVPGPMVPPAPAPAPPGPSVPDPVPSPAPAPDVPSVPQPSPPVEPPTPQPDVPEIDPRGPEVPDSPEPVPPAEPLPPLEPEPGAPDIDPTPGAPDVPGEPLPG